MQACLRSRIHTITNAGNDGGSTIITETKKTTYPQDWKAYDTASEQQKEVFQKLLNDLCDTIDEQPYSFGRPKMPMRDMIFASALKVYSTLSLRRFATGIREAQSKGYLTLQIKSPQYL